MTAPDRLPRCGDCGLLGHQHHPEDPCGPPPIPAPRRPVKAHYGPADRLDARCAVYVILNGHMPRLRASEVMLRAVDGSTAYVTTTTPRRRRWRVDLTAGTAVEVLR